MRKVIPIIAAIIFLIASCSRANSDKDNEEISKMSQDYISGLLPRVREAGVLEISIISTNITLEKSKSTAKLDIIFKVYNPETGKIREDLDTVTFSLKKSDGKWQITDTKFQKTRW